MSSLPGGAADKLGNAYEHWWTAYRAADVLRGTASRIRLEPPGVGGRGIEFTIDEPGKRWCEQVKDSPAGGRWTPRRLTREGVFGSILDHLIAGHNVRLVLSTDASELDTLIKRARATESLAEFKEIVSGDLISDFQNLAATWNKECETTWRCLQRLHVEHFPSENLHRLATVTYQTLVAGDPDGAINELRGFFIRSLHQTLTAPAIWARLKKRGFPRRLLAYDDNTIAALRRTVDRQFRRVRATAPAFGVVNQPYTDQLIERLLAEKGPQIIVCHGQAGLGKSTVVANAIEKLANSGWFAAVARLDGVDANVQTASALGRTMDLADSPAILLAGVADGASAVLVIDQLDAISLYSGRMPDAFESVTEVLDQLSGFPNVKVVLVARTVDLENDPRLSQLVGNDARVERFRLAELDIDAVRHTLAMAGTDLAQLTLPTLELLCVPLHLAVFSRLSDAARTTSYRTLQELYEQYTNERRASIERRLGHLDWNLIIGRLASYMSDNEVLAAPVMILDRASRLEINALESDGILLRGADRIEFFHETYFDFIFARVFVAGGRDLHDFLVESGQYLFRRAQTRQVLEYLASINRGQFRRTVAVLLTSSKVRSHLHDVILAVLHQLDADTEDWLAIEPVAWGSSRAAAKVRALLSNPQWFDAADQNGRWERWLADANTLDAVFQQLVIAARERPARAVELLLPYVGTSDAWRARLRALIGWSLSPDLVDLVVDLIERGELDDDCSPITANRDFWSIIHPMADHGPDAAARLMGTYLRRKLARAHASGSGDPFDSGYLTTYSSEGGEVIMGIARAAAVSFVENVLPFVIAVAQAGTNDDDAAASRQTRWDQRYLDDHHSVDGALFAALDHALCELAAEHSPTAIAALRQLANASSDALRFLTCRMYTVLGLPDDALVWLLSDDRNLCLGWGGSPYWASRQLIETTTPRCGDSVIERLTNKLLDYYPEWERRADARKLRGRAQYELLSAIVEPRRTGELRRKLGELERKFAESPPTPPQTVKTCVVDAPISSAAAEHMTDDDWRHALVKHSQSMSSWRGERPSGGLHELTSALGRRAAQEPQRFAVLGLAFDNNIPLAAWEAIISNVTIEINLDTLNSLCTHAWSIVGSPIGPAVCRAIKAVAPKINDTLIEVLEGCATDFDPNKELARIAASPEQLFYGGELLAAGVNSTRGEAAITVAAILIQDDKYVDRLVPTVTRLANDSILAVRVCAAEAVMALMNHRPAIALDLAEQLLTHPNKDVLDAHTTEHLLAYSLIRDPERFTSELNRALGGPPSVAQRAGGVWAIAAMRDILRAPVPQSIIQLKDPARRGAAAVFANNVAQALSPLQTLFNDPEPDVRKEAARAIRNLSSLSTEQANNLITKFLDSKAFTGNLKPLTFALKNSTTILPNVTINVCEQAIQVIGRDPGNLAKEHAGISLDLIPIILRLYRQGGVDIRSRCLDLVDRLSDLGTYGLNEALENER